MDSTSPQTGSHSVAAGHASQGHHPTKTNVHLLSRNSVRGWYLHQFWLSLTFTNHSSLILMPVICGNGSCAVTGPGWSGTHYSLCCVTRRELLAVVTFVHRSVYTCWAHTSSCGLTTVLSSASGISRNLKDSSLIGLRGYRSMTSRSNTALVL